MSDKNQDHWHNLIVETLQAGTVNIPYGLLKYYKRLHLNEAQTMLIIQLFCFRERDGKTFPTVAELEQRMVMNNMEVARHLRDLVEKKIIGIVEETDENGLRSSRYDFGPLYETLAKCYLQDIGEHVNEAEEKREAGMVTTFEHEFGRPLSPMECEILVKWLEEDKLSDELILAALKEAVFAGKLNFKYIDRILLEWQRNRVRTVQQANQHAYKFRKKGAIYEAAEKKQHAGEFPFYNWLKS